VVSIDPSGTIFNIPITVTIPYKDEAHKNFLTVFTADDEKEEAWTIYDYVMDTIANRVTFKLPHLSKFNCRIY